MYSKRRTWKYIPNWEFEIMRKKLFDKILSQTALVYFYCAKLLEKYGRITSRVIRVVAKSPLIIRGVL